RARSAARGFRHAGDEGNDRGWKTSCPSQPAVRSSRAARLQMQSCERAQMIRAHGGRSARRPTKRSQGHGPLNQTEVLSRKADKCGNPPDATRGHGANRTQDLVAGSMAVTRLPQSRGTPSRCGRPPQPARIDLAANAAMTRATVAPGEQLPTLPIV